VKPLKKDIAAHIGKTPARVSQLITEGMPIYSLDAAKAWYEQHYGPATIPAELVGAGKDARQQPPAGDAAGAMIAEPVYTSSRARREAAEARIAELDLAEREGMLGRTDEFEKTGRRLASAIIQQLDVVIERFPAQFGVDDAQRREMRRVLREDFDRIRAEFAKLGMMAVQ
jgi:hypothetical protein